MKPVRTCLTLVYGAAALAVPSAHAQQTDVVAPDAQRARAACDACLAGEGIGLHAAPEAPHPDTTRRRAIEYSDAYAIRLKIHQIGSYAELPLFAAEYVLGQKLLTDERNNVNLRGSSLRGAHRTVALGLGVLFASNTVTGVWNLVESRHDPAGRTRRWIHSLAMLAADGGFLLTAQSAGQARRTDAGANRHRNLAIGSMSLAAASTIMMWLWRN